MSNSVTLIGGEDLPKVSTQALKQQYEKTIEEATPAKEIKVMIMSVYLNRHSSDLPKSTEMRSHQEIIKRETMHAVN